MAKYSIVGLSGSLRKDSINTKLLYAASRHLGDCDFTNANLRLPLYDGDMETESGVPQDVRDLADDIATADAVLISTPEYNKGPSGVLKNALDWVSRVETNPWDRKPVAVMSAAAGRAGGERAQMVLRGFLVSFRPRVLQGPEVHLSGGDEQFGEDGSLVSKAYTRTLSELMSNLRDEIGR
jgi:chromate reductase